MERWLIPELGQEMYKMALEHLVVPGSREVLRKQSPTAKGMSKRPRRPLRELPMAKAEQSEQQEKENNIGLGPKA